ncbi:hypothetical protein E4U09_005115 [Claviceps aff. purpurea]|uniref:Uncharacterized protein n=1 Tax=Claviceps aff. purpurea TaxID=1967640 RepID=A0A9P7U3W4_9HYPO|nr:hypothetical protein E4U09_005115 [Claviceps aff. purpurea]
MADCSSGSCVVRFTTRSEKRNDYENDPLKAGEIWQGLRDDVFRIGQNYLTSTYTLSSIEGYLHDAWDEFIHAALLQPADSAELDRLVTLILEVRELGGLSKQGEQEAAVMSHGQRLWTDLPFLAEDLYAFWSKESDALTAAQRASLAAFTGKLCAVGVCAPALARCALWLFKRAFETEISAETMAEMLPACREWFFYGNTTLVKLCRDNHGSGASGDGDGDGDGALETPGPLVTDAETKKRRGFSIARWLLWRRCAGQMYAARLGQASGEAAELSTEVSKLGRACFEQMVSAGLVAGVTVPGEKVFLERLFKALDDELASGRATGCVGAEDIEIDVRWAEEDAEQ